MKLFQVDEARCFQSCCSISSIAWKSVGSVVVPHYHLVDFLIQSRIDAAFLLFYVYFINNRFGLMELSLSSTIRFSYELVVWRDSGLQFS